MCDHNTTNGRAVHPMAEFTKSTRMPIERAIEVVEDALEPRDLVLRRELHETVRAEAPEAASILDHTIQVFIKGGYVRRVHLGPDRLAYQKTERWDDRNETLIFIRAPHYKKRFRPRSKAALAAKLKMGTVSGAKNLLRSMPSQADMFGGAA